MSIEEKIDDIVRLWRENLSIADQEAKARLQALITKEIKQARIDEYSRCVKIMYKMLGENYTYSVLYGEIKHPDGKTDINKLLQEYTELEPERQKFSDFVEERINTLNED